MWRIVYGLRTPQHIFAVLHEHTDSGSGSVLNTLQLAGSTMHCLALGPIQGFFVARDGWVVVCNTFWVTQRAWIGTPIQSLRTVKIIDLSHRLSSLIYILRSSDLPPYLTSTPRHASPAICITLRPTPPYAPNIQNPQSQHLSHPPPTPKTPNPP